jgi:hypothetical protein
MPMFIEETVVTPPRLLIRSGKCLLGFNCKQGRLFHEARVFFDKGRQIKEAENYLDEFKKAIKNESEQMFHYGQLKSGELVRRMASSGMLRRVALVRTDVSEELSASFITVTRIDELGTT